MKCKCGEIFTYRGVLTTCQVCKRDYDYEDIDNLEAEIKRLKAVIEDVREANKKISELLKKESIRLYPLGFNQEKHNSQLFRDYIFIENNKILEAVSKLS